VLHEAGIAKSDRLADFQPLLVGPHDTTPDTEPLVVGSLGIEKVGKPLMPGHRNGQCTVLSEIGFPSCATSLSFRHTLDMDHSAR
jgi:hypothetical protein